HDVRPQPVLDLHRDLGREAVHVAVDEGAEGDAVVVDVGQALLALGDVVVLPGGGASRLPAGELAREHLAEAGAQAHHLEAAGVGVGGAGPVHEGTQAAGLVDQVVPGLEVEVVGVGQQRLRPEVAHRLRQHRLDRGLGADGDEGRRGDLPVRGADHPGARLLPVPGEDLEPAVRSRLRGGGGGLGARRDHRAMIPWRCPIHGTPGRSAHPADALRARHADPLGSTQRRGAGADRPRLPTSPAARKGITISSPGDPPHPRHEGRRRHPRSAPEPLDGSGRHASAAEDWQQPAPRLADALEDWTQEPETADEPAPRSAPVGRGSALSAWIAGPLPSQTSSLDDWLQGPIELHAEREAEDAWSTSGSVSGTWGLRGEEARSRSPEPPADGAGADPTPAELRRARPAFRRELHGLRAVALGLVAVYHIWLGRASGGVDVFLFLSAFFLTGTFVRRLESGRPLGIPRYWLHTFKRLMPPAAVTILLVLAGTAALLPSSMWQTIMQEAVASALYLHNLLLVLLQVDYHARDAGGSSPLQRFWSLSVQGQAFVVWPLLFLLVARRARAGRSVRRPLIALVSVIGAASLTWSILSTQSQQQIAYFDTAARM